MNALLDQVLTSNGGTDRWNAITTITAEVKTEVDGITVPTKRHVHIRNQDRSADLSWIPITLDLTDIRFH